MLQTNVGMVDRIVRILIGITLLALVFVGPETPWGWFGIVPLLSGLVGFCPLYKVLGMNTCGSTHA